LLSSLRHNTTGLLRFSYRITGGAAEIQRMILARHALSRR